MNRERLLTYLPQDRHANARWVYQRLEEHLLSTERCGICVRHGNELLVRGDALLHVKNLALAHDMDVNAILAALGQKLIWYLPIKSGVKITFLQLRTEALAV
jgi:hypothetical protein